MIEVSIGTIAQKFTLSSLHPFYALSRLSSSSSSTISYFVHHCLIHNPSLPHPSLIPLSSFLCLFVAVDCSCIIMFVSTWISSYHSSWFLLSCLIHPCLLLLLLLSSFLSLLLFRFFSALFLLLWSHFSSCFIIAWCSRLSSHHHPCPLTSMTIDLQVLFHLLHHNLSVSLPSYFPHRPSSSSFSPRSSSFFFLLFFSSFCFSCSSSFSFILLASFIWQ